MPLSIRFVVSCTNWPNWFSFRVFHGLDSLPGIVVGRVVAFMSVDKPPSGDRISTDTYSSDRLAQQTCNPRLRLSSAGSIH